MGALADKKCCKCSCRCGCCGSSIEGLDALAPDEDEIDFPSYKSKSDEFLSPLEQDNNYFNLISLAEYATLLDTFSVENATLPFEGTPKTKYSYKDEFLVTELYPEYYQSFIQYKILKSQNVIEEIAKNDEKKQIFSEYNQSLFNTLTLKMKQGLNQSFIITKKNVLPLGMLYCPSTNVGKMRLLFDLFKNEDEEFIQSQDLDEYLLSTFLLASISNLTAKNKLAKHFKSVGAIDLNELTSYVNVSELKDNQNLVKFFNDNFFKEKKKFNWEEFKKMFGSSDKISNFAWIFSAPGIRQKLEENNI